MSNVVDGTITQETHRFDLRTLPGAFVELRQLPYYEMLVRRDKGTVASMEQEVDGRRGRGNRNKPRTAKMILESLQTWEREYMFKNCIVNHNIGDKNGVLIDFRNPEALKFLRPDVGMEIERLIDDLNAEGDDFQEDFPNAASSYLEHPKPELSTLEMNPTDTPTS